MVNHLDTHGDTGDGGPGLKICSSVPWLKLHPCTLQGLLVAHILIASGLPKLSLSRIQWCFG